MFIAFMIGVIVGIGLLFAHAADLHREEEKRILYQRISVLETKVRKED